MQTVLDVTKHGVWRMAAGVPRLLCLFTMNYRNTLIVTGKQIIIQSILKLCQMWLVDGFQEHKGEGWGHDVTFYRLVTLYWPLPSSYKEGSFWACSLGWTQAAFAAVVFFMWFSGISLSTPLPILPGHGEKEQRVLEIDVRSTVARAGNLPPPNAWYPQSLEFRHIRNEILQFIFKGTSRQLILVPTSLVIPPAILKLC